MSKRIPIQCPGRTQTRGRVFSPAFPHSACSLLLLIGSLAACILLPSNAAGAEKASFRFLRGVYLLRQLSPGDHWPPVTVPLRVINHDTTNALALHPDKPFVLGQIAQDLATIRPRDKLPLAPYYAAYAYEMLGQYAQAAAEMREYTESAACRPEDHIFLVRNLYRAGKYQSAREAAARWRALDGGCNEQRLEYVWGSFRAEGRHGDAMAAILTDSCRTWRSRVLYEDSRRELGDEREAEAGIQELARENPSGSREIYLLWNRLAARAAYP